MPVFGGLLLGASQDARGFAIRSGGCDDGFQSLVKGGARVFDVYADGEIGRTDEEYVGATVAERWDADGPDDLFGLSGGIDGWDDEAGGAEVEGAFDFGGVDAGDADDGGGVAALGGHDLDGERVLIAGAVFAIDQDPVEAGEAGDFRREGEPRLSQVPSWDLRVKAKG